MKKISDLKVPELHDELTKRGLPKKGKKQELIEVRSHMVKFNVFFYFPFRRNYFIPSLLFLNSGILNSEQESIY